MDFDCELRMLLHQSHAGCLIGKGGSRIKELREVCKLLCILHVYDLCLEK